MNISAHGKYPVRHKNMWHGGGMITVTGVRAGRMITDKGVRAGINPAPTNPPLQTDLGAETIPRNSVSRVTM